jgi:hypothetical protein
MLDLNKHKVTIEGEDYIPFAIAEKAYKEIYDAQIGQRKLDNALKLLDDSVKSISTVLSSVEINDKNSTRES